MIARITIELGPVYSSSLFFKDFIYLILERGREGERGQKHQCVVANRTPPAGDLACHLGLCPN